MKEKEKFIQMIEEHPEINRYKRIEKLINENKALKSKMAQLKGIQKQLVNAKHIQKKEAIETFQKQYDQLYEELESYPLMSDYLMLQSEINEIMQSIVQIIEDGIEKDFE